MRTTDIYCNEKLVRREKLLSLKEFVSYVRLEPGQRILIGDVSDSGVSSNTESFWIGDATPYHKPSTNDGEIGWLYSDPMMSKMVLEVHTFR